MSALHNVLKIILYAQDMDAMVRFYRDTLGLTVRTPYDDYADAYWVEFETGACTLVLHGGGSAQTPKESVKVVFGVDDIHAARAALVEKGARLGDVRSPAPGVYVCDGIDPEGNPFSIDAHDT